ncbi:hypothetical protein [Archangium sp.]|jgi:hypothetical protein|uniref:hypothetical protein n=1 Tax=Archangium sp. TaxID=1872627 RepID=UPI002ED95E17
MKILNVLKAATLSALALGASQALAYDGSLSISGKSGFVIQTGSMANATGYGIHFSPAAYSDGMGGYDAECNIMEASGNIFVYCFDGYQDANNHHNQFFMPLGSKANVTGVVFTVYPNEVRAVATVLTVNPYTTERKPYTVTGTFPLRQSSGYWRSSTVYYQANSVLANSGRMGGGYSITSAYTF